MRDLRTVDPSKGTKMPANQATATTSPTRILRTVRLGVIDEPGPQRQGRPTGWRTTTVRSREYLTPTEVETLAAAARARGRYGARDAFAIRFCARHGFRASELVALRWDQVDLAGGLLLVNRLKRGVVSTHPLQGWELRALRQLKRDTGTSRFVFIGERGPLTRAWLQRLVERAGQAAGFAFPVHPHMLRHAAGYHFANAGQDTRALQHWLGHRSIEHTVRYTELSAVRFKDW
jgi:type 1 fimbriae regulatory protein FimE